MPLPDPLRVKLSTEAAEYVALTPVVIQDMPLREVVERIVCVTGKNAERVCEILHRGSLVSGSSRLRWQPLSVAPADLDEHFRALPDDDPDRPFQPALCIRFALLGGTARIELPRTSAEERRFFRGRSFWQEVHDIASASSAEYCGYVYRERADRYRVYLVQEQRQRLRDAAGLLRYARIVRQVETIAFDCIDFLIPR